MISCTSTCEEGLRVGFWDSHSTVFRVAMSDTSLSCRARHGMAAKKACIYLKRSDTCTRPLQQTVVNLLLRRVRCAFVD